MKTQVKENIIKSLKKSHGRGVEYSTLKKLSKSRFSKEFRDCLTELMGNGTVLGKNNVYYLSEDLGLFRAEIIKSLPKYCFARILDSDEQIFIPGRFSKGAVVGDMVLTSKLQKNGGLKEGEINLIYKYNNGPFTGVLAKENGRYCVVPDNILKEPVLILQDSVGSAKVADKVSAKICRRGSRQSEHVCEIILSFGSACKASVCAKAILESSGAKTDFPKTVYDQAFILSETGISKPERSMRLDLTNLPIFTIDSAESKDLDDAVSIEMAENGYKLGVHIADVAHYVKFRSPLDIEAYERGTSIYYANKVVPMLPEPLSNGICSLNPNEERLALSVLIHVDFEGKINSFKFVKTVIKSRVKGVYSEVNAILSNSASSKVTEKYREVIPSIKLMHKLYQILKSNKIKRGAPQLESTESKIILDSNENAVDIKPAKSGTAEGIIEEFMLLANESAAILAQRKELPFVYRIHEQPSPEKAAALKEMADRLGLYAKNITPNMKPKVLALLLEKTRGTDLFGVMNMQVLRSMQKARYLPDPIGHYGLVLKNYAHFTSPIRRYPDLMVHRILTDYLAHKDKPELLRKKYKKFVVGASNQATATEKRAMEIERSATDCYKAEYMKKHIGEEFEGIIVSIINKGMFVGLENTVEGYVKVESMEGFYEYDGFTKLVDSKTGQVYRIGQKVNVICASVDVNAGHIDFELASD